jgi:sodium-dependent dicarboxylate transporter 2/3/5
MNRTTTDEQIGQSTKRGEPLVRKDVVGILAAAAVMGAVMALPTPPMLPPAGHRIGALFAGVLVLWSTEAAPLAVGSLLVLILQPLVLLGTPGSAGVPAALRTAFTTFISPVFFFLIAMFCIALAWSKTGLDRRFALWMVSRSGTDARRSIYLYMFGTGAISTVMSDVPCCAIFMAIAHSTLQKLGLKPLKSAYAKALMIGIPIAALIGGIGTPAGSSINILGLSMVEAGGGARTSFLQWTAIGIPVVIVLLPIAAFMLLRFYPPEIKTIGVLDDIESERKAMGPISRQEWKVIGIMLAMIALWVASSWIPAFDIVLVALTGACLMFLPGFRLFRWQEAQNAIGWEAILLAGSVTSLGAASGSSGLAKWIVDSALGGLADWSTVSTIAVISLFTVLIHLVLPVGPVIPAVMIPPIMLLAQSSGANPVLYALPVVFTASCAFLLPLDPVSLITYSKGYYRMVDMLVPGLVISLVWVVLMTLLLMLVGPAVGLL